MNYEHFYNPEPSNPPAFWDHGKDIYNFQANLGITYRF